MMTRSDWSHRAYIASWAFLFLASALDGWATIKGMSRLGSSFEANPIFRSLFELGSPWFWAYKVGVVVGFIWLIDKLIHAETLLGLRHWLKWQSEAVPSGVARRVLKWEVAGLFVCVGLVFVGFSRDWMWTLAQTQPRTEVAWLESSSSSVQEGPQTSSSSAWHLAGSFGRPGERKQDVWPRRPADGIKEGKNCGEGAFQGNSCPS